MKNHVTLSLSLDEQKITQTLGSSMDEPTYWLFHNNHFIAICKLGTL
jgi:hypothetical protein